MIATPLIAGNWKMHMGPDRAGEFFSRFLASPDLPREATVAFFPPSVSLAAARLSLGAHSPILLGIQNIHWEESGAFTGEISAGMAAEAGARLALIGHSERRHVFGETDEQTARKTRAALAAGLLPVLCVGETLEQREAGQASEVVEAQLAAVLDDLPGDFADRFVIAYEPVWAIGTGRTASPLDAEEMHVGIRRYLEGRIGADAAAGIPLLYGGSVKADNAAGLLQGRDVDGLLVGGASLDPEGFARICAAAR
jgi:triosephosphate isomerase (TIM)